MNIMILGAGRVGESVAQSLALEQDDITVIDTDAARLRQLGDRFDLCGVVGNGIQPSVLREAGAQDADMVIGCAADDETNLVVCKVAHQIFNVSNTVARLRSPDFVEGSDLLGKGGFAVDHVICPEESVTRYIHQLIRHPEALYRLDTEIEATPDTRIMTGDEVFVLADGRKIRQVLHALHGRHKPVQRVMIAGGGRVRLRLGRLELLSFLGLFTGQFGRK